MARTCWMPDVTRCTGSDMAVQAPLVSFRPMTWLAPLKSHVPANSIETGRTSARPARSIEKVVPYSAETATCRHQRDDKEGDGSHRSWRGSGHHSTAPAGLRRRLRDGRPVAPGGGAAHVAHDGEIVETAHPVHGGAVVPDHEVVLRPAMGVDELGPGGVLREVADEGHRLGLRPTQDGPDMGRQEQRLAP